MQHSTKVICWDMEMCCWGDKSRTGEIISIGLCELNLSNGEISRERHFYVKPMRDRVSDYCSDLTGITQKMVDRQGRPLQEVVNSFTKSFGTKKPYVAWGTDAKYLAQQCFRSGFRSPLESTIDAGLLYRLKARSGSSIGLSQALLDSGIEFQGQAHNALNDAHNLARLISASNLL